MFKKIANIRNFGVFHHFTGGALPEFAPFNLIYGWNYSGKTTLSRVFRCLETKECHPDYPGATFDLQSADGTSHDHSFAEDCSVRVFNEDFRKTHLRWDSEEGFDPVLLLGAENIERLDELNKKRAQRTRLDEQRTEALSNVKTIESTISKVETDCASQIVKELPVGRFTKANLRPIVAAWNGVLPTPMTQEAFSAARLKVTAEQKDALPSLAVAAGDVSELWRHCSEILATQLGSATSISRLVDNPEIAKWVEHGRSLHEDTTRCEFCEGELTSARKSALNAHFSDEFDDLRARVASAVESLNAQRENFSGATYPKSAFYADLHSRHFEVGRELGIARDRFNEGLAAMIEALELKHDRPFDVIAPPPHMPEKENLLVAVRRFQELINENNTRSDQFSTARNEAVEELKNNDVAP